MKKKIIFMFNILLLIHCKGDEIDFIKPISHRFKVTYGKEYDQKVVEKAQIVLTNNEDGKTYRKLTNAEGYAQLEVLPGAYKVNVSRMLTPEEYLKLSGQKVKKEIAFNGSAENVKINAQAEDETTIEMVTGRIGSLVLSQIYYEGSHRKFGASFRDQFFELHNNSSHTEYLDGLYFAQIKGMNDKAFDPKYNLLNNGQYDWSKSIDQKDPEKANTDYVYAEEVLQFPGTGKDYPLPSGKSVIVAANAINHKKSLITMGWDDKTRTVYEVPKPELTIDLSKAQFECYFRPYRESLGKLFLDVDIDNPKVPDMEIAFKTWRGRDLILDPFGRDAFVIFRVEKEAFNQYNTVHLPLKILDQSSQAKDIFKQIPIGVIIDGVDLLNGEEADQNPKRLPKPVDAGQIASKKGAYNGESVIRKVSSQIDGKTFYQDTNNSFNDFKVLDHPQVDIE